MNKSDTIGKLTAALSKAKKSFVPISKDDAIVMGGKKVPYADIHSMITATQAALSENGLVVYQLVNPGQEFVEIETVLAHESDEWISTTMTMPVPPLRVNAEGKEIGNTSQEFGKIITYARRYSYGAILCLSAEDNDGNVGSATTPKKEFVKPTSLTHADITKLQGDQRLDFNDIRNFVKEKGVAKIQDVPEAELFPLIDKIKG